MVEYSEEQQKIARLLLDGSKTIEELREKTGIPANELNDEIKGLLNLNVIKKDEENRYKLIEYVEKHVKGFEGEIEEKFRFRMIVEGLSESKEALEKQIDLLETKLKSEKMKIISFEKAEPQKQEKNFTSFIEIEAWVEDFKDVAALIISYGPSSVELISPEKVELGTSEAQEFLNEIVSAVHYYVSMILQLKHKELLEIKE